MEEIKIGKTNVLGITGILVKIVMEWCLFHADILKTVQVIQVSNLLKEWPVDFVSGFDGW